MERIRKCKYKFHLWSASGKCIDAFIELGNECVFIELGNEYGSECQPKHYSNMKIGKTLFLVRTTKEMQMT